MLFDLQLHNITCSKYRCDVSYHCLATQSFQRPIVIQQYGGFDVASIKTITTLEAVVKYHIWEQERHCALLTRQASSRLSYSGTGPSAASGFCMIVDVAGMSMSKCTRDFLGLVQQIAEVDQKHYPERLGVM